MGPAGKDKAVIVLAVAATIAWFVMLIQQGRKA